MPKKMPTPDNRRALPADAQGATETPTVPLRADVAALVESIAFQLQRSYRPAWAIFVQEYLVDANAARAARAAGYTESSAKMQGATLLQHPVVAEALRRLQRERHEQLRVEADDVLLALVRIASFDPRKLVITSRPKPGEPDLRGKFKGLHKLSKDVAACVSGIDFDKDGRVKNIRFWNKIQALDILARHLGLLEAPDASAQLPGGVGALLSLLQPGHLARLTDAEVEQVATVVALAKRVVAEAHAPHQLPPARS